MRQPWLICMWACVLAAPELRAARPLVTDDARLVDPRSCQVESWVRHERDSTEFWMLPGCNFTGNLELTLGGGRTNSAGGTQTTDVQLQAKTLFKPLETNGWGVGLALGALRHPSRPDDRRWNDLYAYAPLSLSYLDDRVVLHTNLGVIRERDAGRTRMTWGIGAEAQLVERTGLVAEVYGQNRGKPFVQFGVRQVLVAERVQVDATVGNRIDGGERWISIGLRLNSPALF